MCKFKKKTIHDICFLSVATHIHVSFSLSVSVCPLLYILKIYYSSILHIINPLIIVHSGRHSLLSLRLEGPGPWHSAMDRARLRLTSHTSSSSSSHEEISRLWFPKKEMLCTDAQHFLFGKPQASTKSLRLCRQIMPTAIMLEDHKL